MATAEGATPEAAASSKANTTLAEGGAMTKEKKRAKARGLAKAKALKIARERIEKKK